MKVWFNGEIFEEKDARISLMTHALSYGTTVFEGIRFYQTEDGISVFRLTDHIDRLFKSAEALKMNVPASRHDIEKGVKDLIKKCKVLDGYVRPMIFYGDESISVYPKENSVNCAIIISDWKNHEGGIRVKTSEFRRINENAVVHGTKVGGYYVNSIFAMEDARKRGFDEALMLDSEGYVSEGPAYNFFIVKGNLLMTPSSRSALFGITRETILEISKELGFESIEKDLTLEEVTDADEAFFCSTAAEIVWIKEIDHIRLSDKIGPVTEKLMEKYQEIVHGRDKEREEWLSRV